MMGEVFEAMKVSFFASCLVDQLFPEVGLAALRVLSRLGVDATFEQDQTCCGQPAFNSGYEREAARVGRHYLETFELSEAVVVPSGSCTTHLKKFLPGLFTPDSEERRRARQLAEKTFEFSEFLVEVLKVTDVGACFPHRVTFHDSCHQLRELGIADQPRRLIRSVSDIEFLEQSNSERCCGFGGTFAVKFSEVSVEMGRAKIEEIEALGVEYVVANDISCLMHLQGILDRSETQIGTLHLAQLLDQGHGD